MWRPFKRKPYKPPASARAYIVWIVRELLDCTVRLLRQSGHDEAHEGVVYWAGRRAGSESFVTTCLAPPARTTPGSFETSSQTNARAIMYLATVGLELVGQVHSHPGTFVGHSLGDDERALMPYEGFLSVVVPSYARRGMLPLTTCGVHVFQDGVFRRLSDAEVAAHFHVLDQVADLRRL